MSANADPRARFAALMHRDDADIDLAEAALLIAAEAYPGLDIDRWLARLDELAAGLRPRLAAARSPRTRVEALIDYVRREQRFVGNQDDYYDRRNSFLNEVLERRTGIPITLALVYMEIGRRAGVPVQGIGFPGHFLAKLAGGEEVVFDPFFGQVLTEEQCERRLQAVLGKDAPFDRTFLRAATAREIVVRILRNLKQIYLQARDYPLALGCSERILLVEPDLPPELRDRGLLYEHLECYAAAQADLERFLVLAPDDDSAPVVREKLIELQRHAGATLH